MPTLAKPSNLKSDLDLVRHLKRIIKNNGWNSWNKTPFFIGIKTLIDDRENKIIAEVKESINEDIRLILF